MNKEKIILIFIFSIFLVLTPAIQALGEYEEQENQILYVDWWKKIFSPYTHSMLSLAPPGSTEVYLGSVKSSRCFSSSYYPITLNCNCDSAWEPYCSANRYYCRVYMGAGSGDCTNPSSWSYVTEISALSTYTMTYYYTNACGQCWKLEYYGWSVPTTTTTTTTSTSTTTTLPTTTTTLPICNNNGVCESGENAVNCPNDCKVTGTLTLALIGALSVLSLGTIIYLLLPK
jgi:hypothetical protein